ncbi:hypothetical protein K1T71_000808 [Dendrolimus kikuchii]|uniref:Uncharacterized protein n=1 Tax=Dendrolimus kikuchii TaxID=765133 RepID=A0ACC1DKG5_9NEOP|nr:hypothetical protein K1T71_000808 [Dendrolimus kikuchii]
MFFLYFFICPFLFQSCPQIEVDKINVHIVPHTHAELGYVNTFYGHYTGNLDPPFPRTNINMKRTLDFVISELWAESTRKFTISDFAYFFHWWSMRDGTVRRMVYQLLRQGRLFFVGGGWGMMDEATTSYHGIIDTYTYTLRKLNATFLGCGRPLLSWQTDVFGHSREFASLMAQMGYDGHFIEPISFDDELVRMRKKALEFIWRGSDDLGANSDIFTHKLFDGYWSPPGFCFASFCTDPLLVVTDTVMSNVKERVKIFIESMLHRQSPNYITKNVMVIMGSRFAYHDAGVWFRNIEQLIDHVNDKSVRSNAGLKLFYSTPACYLKAVYETTPNLPIKQDDFLPFTYDRHTHATGFFTSRPSLKYLIREGHIFLQISKQLQVLAKLFNNDKVFEQFNWIMGAVQDHKIITGGSRDSVIKYYVHKLHVAIQTSTLLIKQAFNKLRKSPKGTMYYRCSFNTSRCTNTYGSQSFIVVYNPLAWNVTMPVRLPVQKFEYDVFDPKMNRVNASLLRIPTPVLRLPHRGNLTIYHELVFMADVPPLGFNIIKKLKNKTKKYLIRQANNIKIDDESLLNMPQDYYDYNDITTESTNGGEVVRKLDKSHVDIKPTRRTWDINEGIDYIQINLDGYKKITNVTLCNGVNIALDIQFYMFVSDTQNPEDVDKKRNPGAFIFRPIQDQPEPLIDAFSTKIYKSDIVEEIHTIYSKYTSLVVKLYKDSPYIEVDWLVGPVPTEDGVGKNIFVRYLTDLTNNGEFYTDSNGRQMIKRIRNFRPTYTQVSEDKVSNLYILRYLMLHRAILTDDVGMKIYLNETEFDKGVIVRGKHYLYISKADYKPNKIYEKKLAKEINIMPQILAGPLEAYGLNSLDIWRGHVNEFSALKNKLPLGVHLLTFEQWNDNTLLIRLENYLEKSDVVRNGIKKVFLKELFNYITIKEARETTLAANMWLKDWVPLQWRRRDKFVENFNFAYGNTNVSDVKMSDSVPITVEDVDLDEGIILAPQQIRNFVVYCE